MLFHTRVLRCVHCEGERSEGQASANNKWCQHLRLLVLFLPLGYRLVYANRFSDLYGYARVPSEGLHRRVWSRGDRLTVPALRSVHRGHDLPVVLPLRKSLYSSSSGDVLQLHHWALPHDRVIVRMHSFFQ